MSNEKLTENNLIIEEADQYKNGGNIVWDAEDRRLAKNNLTIEEANQYKNGGNIVWDAEDRGLFKKAQYNLEYRFIRWSYWFEKPLIKCHEAILLTLGFDPESTYYHERMWTLEFTPEDRVALEDRVENFKMLIGKGRLFESEKEGDLNVLVKLSDVAQYLDDRKISLPPDLKAYIASKEDRCYQLQQQIEQLQIQLAQAKELIKKMKVDQSEIIPIDGLTGLAKRNKLAQDRQGMARIIASYLWGLDDHTSTLPIKMAEIIRKEMLNYCEKDEMPKTDEQIKKWVTEVVPEHLKNKKGRPSIKSKT